MDNVNEALRYRVCSSLVSKFHDLCFFIDNNRSITFAVDFDGTLYEGNTYPEVVKRRWNNQLVTRLQLLKLIYPQFEWILWTCRDSDDLKFACNAIQEELPIVPDAVNTNSPNVRRILHCDPRKVIATLYIDDNSGSISSYCELLTAIIRYTIDRRKDAIMKSELFETHKAQKEYVCDLTGETIHVGEEYCKVKVYPYPTFRFSLNTEESDRIDYIFDTELKYNQEA